MRNKICSILILIISCIISIVAGEFFLRLFFPQPLYSFEKGLFVASPDYGFAFSPHVAKTHRQPDFAYTIKTNAEGFRGREPDYKADTRILVLGDSYGMGQGVSEGKNICDLAYQYFKASGKSLDIFNTSVSGYAGINELGVLKTQLKNYRPNIVILLFFWNDLGVTESLRVQNGYLVVNWGNPQTAPLREWLNNNSHFYALIKRNWYAFKNPSTGTAADTAVPQADIDVALHYIFQMKQFCDQNNTPFVTVLIPVDGVFSGSPAMQDCRKKMIKEMKNHAIAYQDWTQLIPQEGGKYIFKHDQHWNELGNIYFSRYLIRLIDDFLKG
ncbi:MAG: hypothetical protein CSYNP_01131 [Syntrophus sp. SKADARSKE-3]|nr:hypothetical protein [Syntrophus sp. SKADARSKE-3]